jgi:hypothetical protein
MTLAIGIGAALIAMPAIAAGVAGQSWALTACGAVLLVAADRWTR